jgi:fermentation-respiration switch protein FrsA (DUF1100 family)
VAIVGYRVYPVSRSVKQQIEDLQSALDVLIEKYPDCCCYGQTNNTNNNHHHHQDHLGTIVIGHSSGAHIAFLWMAEYVRKQVCTRKATNRDQNDCQGPLHFPLSQTNTSNVTTLIGLSGPYNIDHHFDYEAARGVEEISPLKAANGFVRAEFLKNSPAWKLQNALKDAGDGDKSIDIQQYWPKRTLLVHGIEDETVPFTSSSEAARILKCCGVSRCDEYYAPRTGHQDTAVHLMLGGRVQTAVVDWLFNDGKQGGHMITTLASKL